MTRRAFFAFTWGSVAVSAAALVAQVVTTAPHREPEIADPWISTDPLEAKTPRCTAIAADRLEPGDLVTVSWKPYSPLPVVRRAEERGDL